MRNVLIICGSFPPQSFVGGLRPAMFAKYLRDFGWNPYILTRDFSQEDPRYDEKMPIELPNEILNQIFRVKYSLNDEQRYLNSRTIISKMRDFFYPEYSNPPGLYFEIKDAAAKIIHTISFDLIFVTVPDLWTVTLGSKIAKKHDIPFIVDFRDIHEQEKGLKRSFREWLQVKRFYLRRYVSTRRCNHITTVSKYHRAILSKRLRRECSIIYNGYDEKIFYQMGLTLSSKDTFRIVYVGRILNTWYRNPHLLFKAADELIKEGIINANDISIEFYGSEKSKLDILLREMENHNIVKFFPRIPYLEVPYVLSKSQVALLLTNQGRKGILTTKLFEYIGVKKPILCIPGDNNELDSIIEYYGIGFSISDLQVLKNKLVQWISSFKAGDYPTHVQSSVDFFSRRSQTKILAVVFNKISGLIE